jgi:uncharacterized membrane protein
MSLRSRSARAFLGLVAFSLLGSLMTRLTGLNPGLIAPIASVLTIVAGVIATFDSVPRIWPRLPMALGLGAAAEIVGLATGFPFGRYVYTGAWWPTVVLPSVGRFPLLLPFAWLLMAGAAVLSLPADRGPVFRSVVGGLIAATIDLAMEPVIAGSLGYWRWLTPGPLPGGAPIANFLGWWATATLAGLVLTYGMPKSDTAAPRWVLGGFSVLILGLGLIG